MKRRTDEHTDTQSGTINTEGTETEIDDYNLFFVQERKCRVQLAFVEPVCFIYIALFCVSKRKSRYNML